MDTISEYIDRKEREFTESTRTDKELEDADRKAKTLKQLKDLNATGTAVAAIGAATTAYLTGRYAEAVKKVTDESKKLNAEIEEELKKEVPDEDKIKENKKKIKKLKAARVILGLYTGGATVITGKQIAKTVRGVNRGNKIKDLKKTADLEKKVVATYDNGVREESTEVLTESIGKKQIEFRYNDKKYEVYVNSSELDEEFIQMNKVKITTACINILKNEPLIIKKLTAMYKITGEDLKKSHIDGFEVVSPDTYGVKNANGFLIGIFESPNQIGCVFNGTTMINKSICIY